MPPPAIRQVLYDFGVVSETLNWTRPGWVEMVRRFLLQPAANITRQPPQRALLAAEVMSPAETVAAPRTGEPAVPPIVLQHVSVPRRKQEVPDLNLSEELRAKLVWLAVETGQSVDDALTLLLNVYLEWRLDEDTVTTLANVLALGKQLAIAEIEPAALQAFLRAQKALAEHNCSFEDVPEALRVVRLIDPIPDWTWKDVEAAMGLVGQLLTSEISVDEAATFLARHRLLVELGFDEATAEELGAALVRAGAVGDRRPRVIDEITVLAGTSVDRDRLLHERQHLQADVSHLAQQRHELASEMAGLQECRDALDAECTAKQSRLDVLRALGTLIVSKNGSVQAFSKDLGILYRWLQTGGRQNDSYGGPIAGRLSDKVLEFLQQLVAEAKS